MTLAAFICLSLEEEQTDNFQKDSFTSGEHRSFFFLSMSQNGLCTSDCGRCYLHAGSDPAPQEKLKYHGKGNSMHTGVDGTSAGCTDRWMLCLL